MNYHLIWTLLLKMWVFKKTSFEGAVSMPMLSLIPIETKSLVAGGLAIKSYLASG